MYVFFIVVDFGIWSHSQYFLILHILSLFYLNLAQARKLRLCFSCYDYDCSTTTI